MERTETDADGTGLSAVTKATRVLDCLSEHGELTAGELAGHLSEPITTVYRMLGNLESIGWIERGPRKGSPVRLGIDLIGIGEAVASSLDLRGAARAALARLAETTSETAYLCVQDGHRGVCIEQVDGKYTRTADMTIGGSLPLHQGAGPRAILAFLPEQARDEYLRWLKAAQPNPLTGPEEARLRDDLAAIRSSGYVRSDGDITAGVVSVAAPVVDHLGTVVASITLSALQPQDSSPRDDFLPAVLDAAANVSSALGYRNA